MLPESFHSYIISDITIRMKTLRLPIFSGASIVVRVYQQKWIMSTSVFSYFHRVVNFCSLYYYYLPKTKKFGCVGRGDLTSLFFSKVVKY